MAEEVQEQAPIRVMEIDRFTIFTKPLDGETRSPRLAWCIRDKNPRITVYTNSKADPVANGIISAPMNPETFFILLDKLEEIAKGPAGQKDKITCKTSFRDDNGNSSSTGEKTLLSEVVFGKDEQGIVWISVIAKDRPRIKFEFRLSDYHEIFHGDGSPYTEAEASQLQAMGAITPLRIIYGNLVGDFRQPKPAGAGIAAYTPRGQQGAQQYQAKKPDLSFDDDVF